MRDCCLGITVPARIGNQIGADLIFAARYSNATGNTVLCNSHKVESELERLRKTRGLNDTHGRLTVINLHYGCSKVVVDLLDTATDGAQCTRVRCTGCNHFQDLVLREGDRLVAFAIFDIGDRCTN